MANAPEHNLSAKGGTASTGIHDKLLIQWVNRVVGIPLGQVKTRLHGNSLHILLEGRPCPNPVVVLPRLMEAFASTSLEQFLPDESAAIYRVLVYGRIPNQAKPDWTKMFSVGQAHSPKTQTVEPVEELCLPATAAVNTNNQPLTPNNRLPISKVSTETICQETSSGAIASLVDLARLGRPDAIARYLSEALSDLGIAVRVKVEGRSQEAEAKTLSPSFLPTPPHSLARLLIRCEAAYSPDLSLLAEKIAHRLRELELEGFQDGVVFGQVSGEINPEWVLRVDLTPPDQVLREWVRWGDVQAISRLLNRVLLPQGIQVSALLKDVTLHLTCQSTKSDASDQLTAIAAIAPLLNSLAPQGIHAATIYGVANSTAGASLLAASHLPQPPSPHSTTPQWVHWLDLPAATQPALAPSTLELAQQGNLEAMAFLLTRLLNADLDAKLATGGVRVQMRRKEDLLHIMTDALVCPKQDAVGVAIVRFLQPLQIPEVTGVRVYGRRSGQKIPLWSYGADFVARKRLVPEVAPEFAASDAYVGELLASPPGALVLHTEAMADTWNWSLKRLRQALVQGIQRSLIKTQLFAPVESTLLNAGKAISDGADSQASYKTAGLALVWSTVGCLLVVQTDWVVGRWLQPATEPMQAATAPQSSPAPASPVSVSSPVRAPLPNLSLSKSKSPDGKAFNNSGFTQPGTQILTPPSGGKNLSSAALPASPLQPKATFLAEAANTYPSFNSRQLDEKLSLYRQYLAKNGAPDILIIGSSRALRGVDSFALQTALAEQGYPGLKVFNLGINGATAQVADLVVRQMLPREALPKLIIWADGARAFNSGRVDVTYSGILASQGYRSLIAGNPPIPGTLTTQVQQATAAVQPNQSAAVTEESTVSPISSRYQAVNKELNDRLAAVSVIYSQRDRLKAVLRDRLANWMPTGTGTSNQGAIVLADLSNSTSPAAAASGSPPSILADGHDTTDIYGFLPLPNRFNPATYYQKYAHVTGDYDSDYESFNLEGKQTEALANLMQFSQTHQIRVVFVNLPLTNDYLDPTRKRYEEQFQQQMLQLSSQMGFTYRDLSQILANQPDYFSDPSHLNRYGGYVVAQRLAQDGMMPWSSARR